MKIPDLWSRIEWTWVGGILVSIFILIVSSHWLIWLVEKIKDLKLGDRALVRLLEFGGFLLIVYLAISAHYEWLFRGDEITGKRSDLLELVIWLIFFILASILIYAVFIRLSRSARPRGPRVRASRDGEN